jgi:RHS repeat-associated protein
VSVEDLKFISDPMLFGRHIVEWNATDNALVRTYVWGRDLSGTMDGAGGVGGLLMICNFQSPIGHHFAAYDGNGNVVALVSATTGTETARYEYGPFAEPIRISGPSATLDPFRFSTKSTDNATDLLLYEYRVYNPSTGLWPNRDPIGEMGFEAIRRPMLNEYTDVPNLYAFVLNEPLNKVDYFGLAPGGPYHPPSGVSLSCDQSDSCGRIRAKMTILMRMIASHTGWDRNMPPPRGGRRHSDEIDDLWRAYAKCQEIHYAKNCRDPRPPKCWERVILKVPGSDQAWKNIGTGCLIVGGAVACGAIIIGTGGSAVTVPALAF